jgi:multiple sugar transport system substrate-binding protein
MERTISRRSFTTLGFATFGALLVAACSQASPPAAAPTSAPAVAPTTAPAAPTTAPAAAPQPAATPAAQAAASTSAGNIRWQFRGSADDLKAAQKFLDDTFSKAHANIKTTIEPAPDNRDEKLITSMVANTSPDVFESWTDNVTQYADRGQVLDVDPLAKRDFTADELKDFYPWQLHDFVLPSHIRFGLPKYVNVMFTWYNKDAFDKAGIKPPDESWTHDDYAQAAIKLTSKNSGGNVDQWGLYYPIWNWDRFWYKIIGWGGQVVDPNDTTKCLLDGDKAQAALEWSRKLMWDDKAMAQRLLLAGAGQSYNGNDLFAAGKFAMVEDGFYPFAMAKSVQKKINWGYQHTPKMPGGDRKVLGTTDGFVIWKNTKSQDASWELLKFLSGKDYQTNQVRATGLLPVRFSVLADWKKICVQAFPELDAVNLDVGPKAMEMGYPGNRVLFKKDAEARQILVPALEKVFISGDTPVSYFKDIVKQVNDKMTS